MHDPLIAIYQKVGADEPYYRLVEKFYEGVETDSLLRPLYPEDLSDAKRKLALFLIQRTGGHTTYSDERGHPRMRARHMPFPIGTKERDAWLTHMGKALESIPEFKNHKPALSEFFTGFADFMRNRAD